MMVTDDQTTLQELKSYQAQKFAMVLSSLNIHGINGSRTS